MISSCYRLPQGTLCMAPGWARAWLMHMVVWPQDRTTSELHPQPVNIAWLLSASKLLAKANHGVVHLRRSQVTIRPTLRFELLNQSPEGVQGGVQRWTAIQHKTVEL